MPPLSVKKNLFSPDLWEPRHLRLMVVDMPSVSHFQFLKVLMTFKTLPPPIFISTFWKIKIINWGTKRSLIIKLSCLRLWIFYHPHEFVSAVLQTCVAVLWVVWTLPTRNKIKIKYKFIVTSQVLAFSCDNLSFKSISVKVIQKYHFNYMLSYRQHWSSSRFDFENSVFSNDNCI